MATIPEEKDTPEDAEVTALLKEAGQAKRDVGRELVRRLTMPLPKLLREGGA